MQIQMEYELNREYIRDFEGEPIGEKNFVVPGPWLIDTIKRHWPDIDVEEFLDTYEPEVEGEYIFRLAYRADVLVETKCHIYPEYDTYYCHETGEIVPYDIAATDCIDGMSIAEILTEFIEVSDGPTVFYVFEHLPDDIQDEILDTVGDIELKKKYTPLEKYYEVN